MMKTGRASLQAALLILTGCGSATTTVTSTWTPPDAQPVSAAGMRIAAVFITNDPGERRLGENALADALTRYGSIGVVSYSIIPANPWKEDYVRQQLREAGVEAVVVMRVVSHDQVLSFTPANWSKSPVRSSLWNYWDFGWKSVYQPGYLKAETLLGVETMLYSRDKDRLLWAGMSQTFDPTTVNEAVKQIARQAVLKMSEENVLLK